MMALPFSVSAISPRVIKAVPDNGAANVDPATQAIVVTFDQPMSFAGQSVVGSGPEFPQIAGRMGWIDEKTFLIPVQLISNRQYRLSINSDRFQNFKNFLGEPATPYPIAFKTGPSRPLVLMPPPVEPAPIPAPPLPATLPATAPAVILAPATAPATRATTQLAQATSRPATSQPALPELNRRSVAELRKAIDQEYSYRDLRRVGWEKLFGDHGSALEKSESGKAFAREAAEMLSAARDVNIRLCYRDETFPTFPAVADDNFNFVTLAKTVPNWRDHAGTLYTGRYPDGVGYLLITTWAANRISSLEPLFAELRDPQVKSLIVDVRMNFGGDEKLARQLAGCFINLPKIYAKHTIRAAGQWQGPFDRVFEPNPTQPTYHGRVVVLTGPQCMEANESFLLMMKAAGATLIGATTFGSSANPKPIQLANGVTVFLPGWQDMRPDGTCFEGEGIAPGLEVKTKPADFANADPVLDAALLFLRSRTAPRR
jgi:hypothetical protein